MLARCRSPKGRRASRVLALVVLVALCCSHKDQNARGTRSSSAGEDSSEATRAAFDLPSAMPEKPLRLEEPSRPWPVHDEPGSAPKEPIELSGLALPAGFSLAVDSDHVLNARSLAHGAKGTVYASTRKEGRVYALIDENGDHKVDRVSVVTRGADTPNGIAYQNGTLCVTEISRLLRLDDIDHRVHVPTQSVVVTDELPDEKRHGWRYIRFGPDGWLYVPIEAPCNVCKPEEPIFSTVSRIKPDGSGLEVFATGVQPANENRHGLSRWFTRLTPDSFGSCPGREPRFEAARARGPLA